MSYYNPLDRLTCLLISICEWEEARHGAGDSIENEILLLSSAECSSSEQAATKGAALDTEVEIKLAFDHRRKLDDSASCTQEMKDLGLKRYVLL